MKSKLGRSKPAISHRRNLRQPENRRPREMHELLDKEARMEIGEGDWFTDSGNNGDMRRK